MRISYSINKRINYLKRTSNKIMIYFYTYDL